MIKLILEIGLKRSKYKFFSMLEIVAVLVILIIVSTIVTKRVGGVPDRVVIEQEIEKLSMLLTHAATMTAMQGKNVGIVYNLDDNTFTTNSTKQIINKKFAKYKPKKDISFEFAMCANDEDDNPVFYFYPDGTAARTNIIIKYKELSYTLNISPLTSKIQFSELNDD